MGDGAVRGRRLERSSLARQLEDALRRDITEGILEPGERLRAADAERRYGVSATPVREALQHLAAEGLVSLEAGLGARVASASLGELRDIYAAREVLECGALELAMARATDAWRAQLTAAAEALNRAGIAVEADPSLPLTLEWSRAHRDFHMALFGGCGSEWLIRFLDTLFDHSERYRMLTRRSLARDSAADHEAVYHAAVEGSVDEGVRALRRHLAQTVTLLEVAIRPTAQRTGRRGASVSGQWEERHRPTGSVNSRRP